ncbi:MerR family transcriptional regulator [Secundilactobacillus folii]|uniref:HTH merR-type domain-containing protein n=1 Tax=Secundilactobacillus folii TaxID=2678357 RepID=A0A7X2XWS0_9LACO|nr:MerR family transcriptional regulator [Secundilactobacillus folii]MTV83104.1 hypothetical protein [Secundilactobacillus folii]
MIQRPQLSAGQFAQLLNIDRHLLDCYDELGLFEPVNRDKNGRRSYDLAQVNQWLSLQAMVGLEPDLNTTKAAVQNYGEDHIKMLKYQQKLIEEQLTQLSTASQQLAKEITSQETARQAMPDVATVVNRPPVNILTTQIPDNVESLTPFLEKHVSHVMDANATSPVHITVGRVHPKHAIETGNPDQVSQLYTTLMTGSEVTPDATQAGGRYVIAYHHGDKPLLEGFQQIQNYAQNHQLSLETDFYEEPVVASWQVDDASQQVVRLLAAVKE